MNFCLSDLVPPLRWSDASTITLLTGQPDLPEAWWRSLPMPRVLAAIGPESLGELLTEIALEHWPAAALGDVLPALHVLDPDEADEPHVAIALDRAGSWPGLLALTSRELTDQPFIQARQVLNTLFSAVLVRLTPPARPVERVAPEPVVEAAPEPVEPEPVAVEEPEAEAEPVADEPAELHAEAPEEEAPEAEEAPEEEAPQEELSADEPPVEESVAEEPSADEPAAEDSAEEEPGEEEPREEEPGEEEPGEEVPVEALPELIEAAFAGLDDKSWAVAQNRVFTDQPSAVDQLAKLFAVPAAEISATETQLRAKLDQWLASEEAAPYRAHLDELRAAIGPAAPRETLIGAADWHRTEIRALEVPAWQFVLATMPDQQPPPDPEPPQPLPRRKDAQPEKAEAQDPQFQAFTPVQSAPEGNGAAEEPQPQSKPYQPLKDVSQTRRCFRQPDGRWWLRIDVTAEQLGGGECALPTGFAAYLGLSPGESRTVRSAAGELTMTWHGRPVLETVERLLVDVGAKEGGHLFLTLSDEGVLRARHLPVAAHGAEKITKALRLVGYTAPGGTKDQAARVIATRIGMTGPVGLPDLLTRLRERGDRDLLQLLD